MQVQAEELNPLTAPLQFEVDRVTSQSIEVSWAAPILGANIPITTYTVSWGISLSDENSIQMGQVSSSQTSYMIDELSSNTTYQITVAAVNRGGTGLHSEAIMTMTEPGRANPPTQLSLVGEVTIETITISWTPPDNNGGSDINGYTIYWGENLQVSSNRISTMVYGHNDYGIKVRDRVSDCGGGGEYIWSESTFECPSE